MSSGTLLRAAVGIAISILAFVLVFSSVDSQATVDILLAAAPGWVVIVVAFLSLDLAIRAFRWRRLLAPIQDVPYPRTLAYLLIGYLANNVLPARLGELVRCHYLGDREGISRATALGTVVVERVIDIAVVVAIAAAAILVLSVRGMVANVVLAGGAIGALLIVGLAVMMAAHRLPGAERVAAAVARWPRVGELARRLREGLAVAGRPRTLGEVLVVTCLAWSASLLAFAAAGQAVGVQLTIGQAALLASGTALAAAIPSGPASLGTFELATVAIARALGVADARSFALAILIHASIVAVTSIGGVASLVRIGWERDVLDVMGQEQGGQRSRP
jgi:glycosyltransferase 2 family protein